jgi:hypothetical protein
VLDRLLWDGRLKVTAISGASAVATRSAVEAQGLNPIPRARGEAQVRRLF